MTTHRYWKQGSGCILVICIFLIYCTITSASDKPSGGWRVSTPEAQGINSKRLLTLVKDITQKGYNIQSIVIARNGQLVLDANFYPFNPNQKHNLYSVTKSITSALIGITLDKGFIKDVNQTVSQLFSHRQIDNLGDLKKSLTLKDLLMMSSGLDCNDASANDWAGTFAMKKSPDWTQYTLDLPMTHAPGSYFHYCNGVSHLLSSAIQSSTGMQTNDFAQKYLFEPLGIADFKWEASPEGTANGFGGLWLKPRDMAKIGQLYLNCGIWNDRQIISSKYVETSTQPLIDGRWEDEHYGFQWWINPAGFYSAIGMYGQAIYVLPDQNSVVVFASNITDENMYISGTLLKEHVIPAFVSREPLPPDPAENMKLNHLLATIAKPSTKGITWASADQGVAKDGLFKRTALPSFTFSYPSGSKKTELTHPMQIMRMETPEGVVFLAGVFDIIPGMDLARVGPELYATDLKKYGSNIKVTENKKFILNCGTQAFRTNLEWMRKNKTPTKTIFVSAYKNGKCVYLITHPTSNRERFESMLQSLSFESYNQS